MQGAQLQWNRASLPTTFVGATQLTMDAPAGLTASAALAASHDTGEFRRRLVQSGDSVNGPPAITSLSPSSVAAGFVAFTLTVNGTGFVKNNRVTLLQTELVNATQLHASATAAAIASAGSAFITRTAGAVSSGAARRFR